jgi:hypothetical protein
MVGFMNRQALDRTFQEGYVTFFSRRAQPALTKGELGNGFGSSPPHRLRSRHAVVARRGGGAGLVSIAVLALFQRKSPSADIRRCFFREGRRDEAAHRYSQG